MEHMAEREKPARKHAFTVDSRERLTATGINRVVYCSDELITAETDTGQFHIKGRGMHIDVLSSDTGDMLVVGEIIAVSYTEKKQARSTLGRLFQ